MKNSARGDSSTGSELKAVEEACREASRTVEPCELCVSVMNTPWSKHFSPTFNKTPLQLSQGQVSEGQKATEKSNLA